MQDTFERLSSGSRINRAKDDAAGLAIAQSLNSKARVYTQGIRNLNDGISYLSIAEGALNESSNILTRIKELATQSANGTFSFAQRGALNQEANALIDEYNRIIQSTEFSHGRKILDGSQNSLALQAGYGANGLLQLSVGDKLSRTVGDGTFGGEVEFGIFSDTSFFNTGDFNSDGKTDFLTGYGDGDMVVYTGIGDGTFIAGATFSSGFNSPSSLPFQQYGDLNQDGKSDLVGMSSGDGVIFYSFGNGNGTFGSFATLNATIDSLFESDVNRDDHLDLVGVTSSGFVTFLGNGNGTFRAPVTTTTGTSAGQIKFADLDNDGDEDILWRESGVSSTYFVSKGDGSGSFTSTKSFNTGVDLNQIDVGELNGDGRVDFVLSDSSGSLTVYLGNGDGTFRTSLTLQGSTFAFLPRITDVNQDGNGDVLFSSVATGELITHFGNGNGTFGSALTTLVEYAGQSNVAFGGFDLNGDGTEDILSADSGDDSTGFRLSNSISTNTIARVSLYSRQDALNVMSAIDAAFTRISSERAQIGAAQSRASIAVNTLQQSVENHRAAYSRIMDADIAEETTKLARDQILQKTSAAVLSQANLQPSLVLKLLE